MKLDIMNKVKKQKSALNQKTKDFQKNDKKSLQKEPVKVSINLQNFDKQNSNATIVSDEVSVSKENNPPNFNKNLMTSSTFK